MNMKLFLWQRQCLINNLKPLIPGNGEGRWGVGPSLKGSGCWTPSQGRWGAWTLSQWRWGLIPLSKGVQWNIYKIPLDCVLLYVWLFVCQGINMGVCSWKRQSTRTLSWLTHLVQISRNPCLFQLKQTY